MLAVLLPDCRFQPQTLKQGLLAAGLPEAYSDFLVVIFGYLKAGYSARTTDSVKTITGRSPIALEKYTADYKAAWNG